MLAEGGASSYRIIVPQSPTPAVQYAAEELQRFLAEMTGAQIPVATEETAAAEQEIILGAGSRLKALGLEIDLEALGREGYVLRTVGTRLVIVGGEPRGTLYGVYGLLEEHFGCRWFAPGVSRIPRRDALPLPDLDQRVVPVLEYREPFVYDCFDGDWAARNRVNSSRATLQARHGGKVRFGSGMFVHTFERLVSPAQYFDEHPEYFSLVKGKRLKERSQLCCTNEEVIALCIAGVRAAMRADPGAAVFSVSQNDWYNYCECDRCQALARREESQMAPVLHLVNRVAEAVADEFPEKAVETLAYQWTRKPPKTMRPRANVIIRLCSIECCFSHPLATCDSQANARFREDAAAWAATGARLWVWDYTTAFQHYLLPFPNQRVLRENIRFFVRHKVTGIFAQDTYNTPHSELAALSGYLLAKYLWNPDYDEETALSEFLEGYYGAAAGPIREYLVLLHDRVEQENVHVVIWVGPNSPHLTEELLLAADRLWREAERRVADHPEVLRRVQISRMSVDYAVVERARLMQTGRLPKSDPLIALARERFEPFTRMLADSGVMHLKEHQRLDLPSYRADLGRVFEVASPIGGP